MPEDAAGVQIRHSGSAEDWQAIRELCCLTGRQGNPIERERWPLFAELWVGPYQRLRPDWSYVAEARGRVVGYLTGCPDSARFRRARAVAWAIPLLLRMAIGRYPRSADARRFAGQSLGLVAEPERRLRRTLPARVDRDYPAHLHMNVDAEARGKGVGRALLERYAADLAARGVPGLQLVCGVAARPFYQRLGFLDLGALEFRPGVRIFALGRRVGGVPGPGPGPAGRTGTGPGAR